MLRPRLFFAIAIVLVAAVAAAQTERAPETRPTAGTAQSKPSTFTAGTVSGRITAESGKTLPEMIVYLEPLDPSIKFDVPREPVHVSQREAKFTPSVIVVCVGQAVDFTNDETRAVEHNVYSRSPAKAFDLGLYKPGSGPKLITFDKPGVVRLACSIHRFMDGIVFVTPTPWFARVGADGAFQIDKVPPGEWRLKTWQRSARFNEREATLTVTENQTSTLNLEMSRK